MDPKAEETIARVYYNFQNRKLPIVKPKIIPKLNREKELESKIINGVEHIIMKEGVKYTEYGKYVYIDPITKEDIIINNFKNVEYTKILYGYRYTQTEDNLYIAAITKEAIDKENHKDGWRTIDGKRYNIRPKRFHKAYCNGYCCRWR